MAHACQVFNNAGTQRKHSTPIRSFLSFFITLVYHHYYGKLCFVYCGSLFILTNTRKEKKIERFLSFPKLASHQQQGDEEGSFASCFTRKKGVKRDLPESQSSHSELEPTGFPLGSAPGTRGAPLQRRSPVVWLTSSGWSPRVLGCLAEGR